MTKIISENSYQNLVKALKNLIANLQENISRQKVEFAWNVGRLIEEDLLKNQMPNYGENLFKNLAQDTEIEKSNLYKMHAFFKSYPNLPQKPEINWSHYQILSAIKNEEIRQNLEDLTAQNSLSVKDLKKEVQRRKTAQRLQAPRVIPLLEFERGLLFHYQIAEIRGAKFLDLGFNIFKEFESNFKAGEIVESVKNSSEFSLQKSGVKKSQIHTYQAYLERVVDGDTIRVDLDLGFGVWHHEILRLAKISAPENSSAEGLKATSKLKEILKNSPKLIIKTNKTDTYGRYIADVFLENEEGQYLNQMLLDAGVVEEY
jgi:endonuclease YncB( thermonuclease family)